MIIRSVLSFVREDIMLAKHAQWQAVWMPGAGELLWLRAPSGPQALAVDAHWAVVGERGDIVCRHRDIWP